MRRFPVLGIDTTPGGPGTSAAWVRGRELLWTPSPKPPDQKVGTQAATQVLPTSARVLSLQIEFVLGKFVSRSRAGFAKVYRSRLQSWAGPSLPFKFIARRSWFKRRLLASLHRDMVTTSLRITNPILLAASVHHTLRGYGRKSTHYGGPLLSAFCEWDHTTGRAAKRRYKRRTTTVRSSDGSPICKAIRSERAPGIESGV